MKLEKIEKLKSGKYQLDFDNQEKIVTYDDVILKNNLLYQKQIDMDAFAQIEQDNQYYEVYHKVIKYITIRLRSEKEIKNYMEKLGAMEESEAIISKLKEVGFINDMNFCKSFVSDKLYLTNYGPDKIKKELEEHEIPGWVIDDVFSKIDVHHLKEKLTKLIQKKIAANRKHSSYQLRQKIMLDMINLGYARDLVLSCLGNVEIVEDTVLEKEFQILYRKLSKKYVGRELVMKLKQKLYQKGFDQGEIYKLIQEKIED